MQKIVNKNIVLIDDEDEAMFNQYTWWLARNGKTPALKTEIKGKNLYFHRMILGIIDPDLLIDHINQNRLDNRKCNLRFADKSTNGMNRGTNKNNKSGYKGVSKYKRKKQWSAELMVKGVRYRIHKFKTPEEAALKYNELAIKYHGEFAVLNVIKEQK